MEIHTDFVAQSLHEIVHQFGLETTHSLLLDGDVVGEEDPPADIDYGFAKRLIKRDDGATEALDSRAITERLAKRASHHDPDVLDRMMLIDMQVAAGSELEIEEAMAREAFEHVVQERNSSCHIGPPLAVEREFGRNLSLARAPF